MAGNNRCELVKNSIHVNRDGQITVLVEIPAEFKARQKL